MLDQPLRLYALGLAAAIAVLIGMVSELLMSDETFENIGGIMLSVVAVPVSIWVWQDIQRRKQS
jgi:hypothetical protein